MPNIENYAKVVEAIHVFCYRSLPTVQASVEDWHKNQQPNLPACQTPAKCLQAIQTKQKNIYKKPTAKNGTCVSCIACGKAVESASHPPGRDVQWKNVNTTLLHKDPVEVAKGFVFIIPSDQSCTQFDHFDIGGILKLMMGFRHYHNGDKVCTDKLQKVNVIYICLKDA